MRSRAGYDFCLWVTTPPGHDRDKAKLPVVYVQDGNWTVGLTAPLIVSLMDPMQRIEPYIQVSIGYAGDDALDWDRLRNRDFVPPGEPIAQDLLDAVELGVEQGARTREDSDAHLAQLRETQADVFLSFLTA